MGIDFSTYIFVGARVSKKKLDTLEELEEDFEVDDKAPDTIIDGICGEYGYIGRILSSVGQSDCFEDLPIPDPSSTIAEVEKIIEKHGKALGVKKKDIKFRVINHIY